ncbi:molecular chaperone DnaJ [Amycolatopsis xylanica]|uniref:Molecular chaperone DnaJ n=1 Tax=Amycolatopsis xylanica TaxID=589385 RepID=A0A1H3CZZ0_9PSEU|nr:DnaJ C-terminal domain-containing protein [Amycolatopsis xylanica]SDX59104.1 molecular chaperone DnaJ [Amycolatopsis xylanica]
MSGIRDALLIATGKYDSGRLTELRSPGADVAELADVLADPAIGWFETKTLVDAPAYKATRAIEKFFRDRSTDDLLVLHLSCHGVKNDDGELFLAAADTELDLLGSTAIPAAFLHEQMSRCRAKSIILLLDCCFSGAALPGIKAPATVDAKEQLAGSGRAILTATNRTEYAWEGNRFLELEPAPSRFTEAIIHGLRTGEADRDGDGRVAVDELYDHVFERLRESGAKQTPRYWADLEYRVFLANTAIPVQPDQPVKVQAKTAWPQRRARRGQDALIRLDVSLKDLALGKVDTLKIQSAIACGSCQGLGTAADSVVERCTSCSGYGVDGETDCERCTGFGTLIRNPCAVCAGDGRVLNTRSMTYRLPRGVTNGMRVRFSEQGEVGPGGGPAADVYLEVVELPDTAFERRGRDLYCTIKVEPELARTGGIVDLATFDGVRKIRIPGGIKSGKTVRVAGLGFPEVSGDGRGNLMVTVDVPRPMLL